MAGNRIINICDEYLSRYDKELAEVDRKYPPEKTNIASDYLKYGVRMGLINEIEARKSNFVIFLLKKLSIKEIDVSEDDGKTFKICDVERDATSSQREKALRMLDRSVRSDDPLIDDIDAYLKTNSKPDITKSEEELTESIMKSAVEAFKEKEPKRTLTPALSEALSAAENIRLPKKEVNDYLDALYRAIDSAKNRYDGQIAFFSKTANAYPIKAKDITTPVKEMDQDTEVTALEDVDLKIGDEKKLSDIKKIITELIKLFPKDDPMASESGTKDYAFRPLCNAYSKVQKELEKMNRGEPDDFLGAVANYKEIKMVYDETIWPLAMKAFPEEDAFMPGNLDATRGNILPLEYQKHFRTATRLNGLFQVASTIRNSGMSIDEYMEDPAVGSVKALKMMAEKELKRILSGFSTGELLAGMCTHSRKLSSVLSKDKQAGLVFGNAATLRDLEGMFAAKGGTYEEYAAMQIYTRRRGMAVSRLQLSLYGDDEKLNQMLFDGALIFGNDFKEKHMIGMLEGNDFSMDDFKDKEVDFVSVRENVGRLFTEWAKKTDELKTDTFIKLCQASLKRLLTVKIYDRGALDRKQRDAYDELAKMVSYESELTFFMNEALEKDTEETFGVRDGRIIKDIKQYNELTDFRAAVDLLSEKKKGIMTKNSTEYTNLLWTAQIAHNLIKSGVNMTAEVKDFKDEAVEGRETPMSYNEKLLWVMRALSEAADTYISKGNKTQTNRGTKAGTKRAQAAFLLRDFAQQKIEALKEKIRAANEAAHPEIIRVRGTEALQTDAALQDSTLVTQQQMDLLSQQRQQQKKSQKTPEKMTEEPKGKLVENVF